MKSLFSLKTFLWAGFLFVTSFFISCTDDESEIGMSILPEGAGNGVYHDSLSVMNAYIYQQPDTIRINQANTFLGYLNDPRFGVFKYHFMAELNPNAYTDTLTGNDITGEKLVLTLIMDDYYGSADVNQKVVIYEINKNYRVYDLDSIPNDPSNVDNIIQDYYGDVVKEVEFDPHLDTVEIELPDSYRDLFIENFDIIDDDTLLRDQVFRGFYFKSVDNNGTGSVNTIDMTTSYLELQFKNINDEDSIHSLKFTMIPSFSSDNEKAISSICNLYEREYNLSEPADILHYDEDTTNAIASNQYLFVKDNNALETRITISGIDQWQDSGVVFFNKVDLLLTPDFLTQEEEENYSIDDITLYATLDTANYATTDMNLITTDYLEIGYDTINNNFSVPLTEAMKDLVNQKASKFSITLSMQNTGVSRVVLCGPEHETNPARLHVVYTKLN